jgi:biotin carboxyl carrier protein
MKLRITVRGVAYEVEVEVLDGGDLPSPSPRPPAGTPAIRPPNSPIPGPKPAHPDPAPGAHGSALGSPVPGTVLEVRCTPGQDVEAGQVLVVLETMKMHTPIPAPRAGTLLAVNVSVGDTVREGQALVVYA